MAETNTKRRWFLGALTSVLMAFIGLLVAIPAVAYVLAPFRRKPGPESPGAEFQDVGPVQDIPIGTWHLLTMEVVHEDGWKKTKTRHGIWVRREADDKVAVLSSICPHLGCPVNWYAARSEFICPCHGGIYDAQGRHIAGPPPRGLDHLKSKIHAEHLWVEWQDFKIGVAESIPVTV
jgi:menaquinol-cytochrome c reductase iron-sulfur subunit